MVPFPPCAAALSRAPSRSPTYAYGHTHVNTAGLHRPAPISLPPSPPLSLSLPLSPSLSLSPSLYLSLSLSRSRSLALSISLSRSLSRSCSCSSSRSLLLLSPIPASPPSSGSAPVLTDDAVARAAPPGAHIAYTHRSCRCCVRTCACKHRSCGRSCTRSCGYVHCSAWICAYIYIYTYIYIYVARVDMYNAAYVYACVVLRCA
jgi:hypothetical protein